MTLEVIETIIGFFVICHEIFKHTDPVALSIVVLLLFLHLIYNFKKKITHQSKKKNDKGIRT